MSNNLIEQTIWRTKSGENIKISDMSESHARNSLKHLIKNKKLPKADFYSPYNWEDPNTVDLLSDMHVRIVLARAVVHLENEYRSDCLDMLASIPEKFL